jgi:hypothetical protein
MKRTHWCLVGASMRLAPACREGPIFWILAPPSRGVQSVHGPYRVGEERGRNRLCLLPRWWNPPILARCKGSA